MSDDPAYHESLIEAVEPRASDYLLRHSGSRVVVCPKHPALPPPSVGEWLRLSGRGLGRVIVHLDIAGRRYR